jgi:hypothetical protein
LKETSGSCSQLQIFSEEEAETTGAPSPRSVRRTAARRRPFPGELGDRKNPNLSLGVLLWHPLVEEGQKVRRRRQTGGRGVGFCSRFGGSIWG